MKDQPSVDVRWSGPQWMVFIGLVFAILVGGIYAVTGSSRHAGQSQEVEVTLLPVSHPELLEHLAATDPAWLALPNRYGHSAAWLTNRGLPHHELYQWIPKQEWLEYNASDMGRVLTEFLRTNRPVAPTVFEKPPPELDRVDPPPVRMRFASFLERTGPLADRGLEGNLTLASWAHTDVLPPSIVQVDVAASGLVLNTRLLSPCGNATVDARALEHARAIRFKPLTNAPPEDLFSLRDMATGNLIFNWHTHPDGVTNVLQRSLPVKTVLPR
ncbi:MAG: hypothetical protein CMO66_04025 [Verrucomicrobiales bacterium]|nr:hypothetical protein [Verrucomicrobiales bacterium]